MEPQKRCFRCRSPLPEEALSCPMCGWHSLKLCRCCLTCQRPIDLVPGLGLSGNVLNGAVVVVFLTLGFMSGFLGSLAVGLFLGAAGRLYSALTLEFRCKGCGRPPSGPFLEEDRQERRTKRASLFAASVGMAAGSIISAVLWVVFVFGGRPPDINALERRGAIPQLIQAMRDERVHGSAGQALQRMGGAAVRPVVQALKEAMQNKDDLMRRRLESCVEGFGRDAVPALIEVLKDENPVVRECSAKALGAVGLAAMDAVPSLTDLLDDRYQQVKTAARAALKKIRGR